MPSATSSRPMGCCLSAFAMKSRRFLKWMVPALVTRFTMNCPGYSSGGRVPVYAVERRRCLSLEGLVGALVVVEVAEVVERALLARQCCPGRTDRL